VRIENLKQNFNIAVEFVHFPLHPETPAKGRSLQDLFGAGPDVIREKHERMKGLMEAEGLPYGERSHTYNSRLAQELGKWADIQPGGEAIHDALFKAYFVDKRNIGDLETLLEIAQSIGLAREDARAVLEGGTFKDAVDMDWAKSRQYGVTGVPTFVAGQSGAVGAQPYDVIARLLSDAGAQPKT